MPVDDERHNISIFPVDGIGNIPKLMEIPLKEPCNLFRRPVSCQFHFNSTFVPAPNPDKPESGVRKK
jgi:hypothetical protein